MQEMREKKDAEREREAGAFFVYSIQRDLSPFCTPHVNGISRQEKEKWRSNGS